MKESALGILNPSNLMYVKLGAFILGIFPSLVVMLIN